MKKDWTEFQNKYRLENSLYNFVIRPGVFRLSIDLVLQGNCEATFVDFFSDTSIQTRYDILMKCQ